MVIDKTCRYVFGIALAILTIFLLSGGAGALSNDGGGEWKYYRDVAINNAGSALTDYQVLVNLTGAGFPLNANKSGADVRFSDASGKELAYWVESWDYANKNAKVWVNLTSVPAGGSAVRMWYGNAKAGSASDGDATFDLYDDFNDGILDSNKWTVTQGNGGDTGYNENAGYLTLWRNTGYGNDRFLRIGSNKQFSNATIEGNIRLTLPVVRLPSFGFGRLSSYNNADENGCELFATTGNSQVAAFYGSGFGSNKICMNKYENVTYNDFNAPYDVFKDIKIDWNPDHVSFYYGNYYKFLNTNVPDENMPVYMYIQTENDAGQSRPYNELKVDWVRVRKYASPEPSVSVGAENVNAQVLFSDDFENYNPQNWIISSGGWSIEIDAQKNGNNGKIISADQSTTNTIYTKDTFSTGISACADTRLVNTNPWWHRGIGLEWGDGPSYRAFYFQYRGDTNELMLDKINFGEWDTILGLQPTSDSLKTSWDRICLEVNGSNLKAILNNQQIFNIEDNDLLSTPTYRIALQAGSSHSHFDNVVVTAKTVTIPASSSISIIPKNQNASIGQNFTVNITVSPSTTPVYSAEFALKFDPSKLEALNIAQGKFLSQDGASTMVIVKKIDNALGEITYGETRVGVNTGVTLEAPLASVKFRVKGDAAQGMSYLNFTKAQLSDVQAEPIPNITVNNGSVNIIANQPPVAVITKPWNAKVIRGEKPETFDASGSYDPDGAIVSYKWDFGDGNTSAGKQVVYQYTSYKYYDGGYHPFNLSLTVTDDKGASSTATQSITPILPGDANLDSKVDILDAALVGLNWGRKVIAMLI